MIIALRLALFLVASLTLLSYLGYTPARLLVRERAARLLLLPALGFCVLVIAASFLNYFLPMPGVLVLTIASATIANLWTARRYGWGLGLPGKAPLAAIALGVLAYAIANLPQVHADTLAFLGVQWDLEIYLPLSEYLKRCAMGGRLDTHPSPLLATMNDPAVRGGSGWGFMYLDSALGSLLGWPSWETYRPTLHLLFGLSAPAMFALCRWGFRMGAGGSLVATGLVALNGLNLWVASIGLGGHVVAFVLLPMSTLGVLWMVRQPTWLAAVITGVFVTGLLMSFYTGAAAVLAAVLVPIGLYALAMQSGRAQLLKRAAAAIGVLAALGLIAHLRFGLLLPLYLRDGLSEGWKVADFLSLSQAVGLAPFILVQQRLTGDPFLPDLTAGTVAAWGTAMSVAVVCLCGLSLTRAGWERGAWLAALLGLGLFAALLRFGSGYPYGYFKVFSLGYFVLAAGIGQGLATLFTGAWLPQRWSGLRGSIRYPSAALATLLTIAAVPLLAANLQQSLRYFWELDPNELPRSTWQLSALGDHLNPGDAVYVSGRSGFDPRFAAMVAYFLMDNPVVGNLKSAYGAVRSERPDQEFEYLLFQRSERPEEVGVAVTDLVWRNELVALYRRPRFWAANVDLESIQAPVTLSAIPVEVRLNPDAWALSHGQPLFDGASAPTSPRQQVEMTLLALQASAVLVTTGGQSQTVDIPAGLVRYRSESVTTPSTLSIVLPSGVRDVRLLGVRILQATASGQLVQPSADLVVLQAKPEVNGTSAQLDLDMYVNSSRNGFTAGSVEFYRRDRSGLTPAGFTQVLHAKRPQSASLTWRGDLTDARCGDAAPRVPRADGEYEGHLALYHVNEEVYRQRWLRFSIRDGRVTNQRLDALPPYIVQYLSPPKEVLALATFLAPGAEVYLPVARELDHSFIATAVATLADRRWIADLSEHDARPGYLLLPTAMAPESMGVERTSLLWEGQSARLYRIADGTALLARPYPPSATEGTPSTNTARRDRTKSWISGALASQEPAALVSAETVRREGTATISVDYLGPAAPGTLIGLDIYETASCAPAHYGWWAAPISQTGLSPRFELIPAAQRVTLADGKGELASQTWPARDGTYRGFVMIKQGETFDTLPAFEFTLAGGQVTTFESLDGSQVVRVRP